MYISIGDFVYYKTGKEKLFAMVKDRLIHYDGRVYLNLVLLDKRFGIVVNHASLDRVEPASQEAITFWQEVVEKAIAQYCDTMLALCNHIWRFLFMTGGDKSRFVCEKCRRTMYPEEAAKKLSERH